MNSNTGKLGRSGLLVESGQGVYPAGVNGTGTITSDVVGPGGEYEIIVATADQFTRTDVGKAVYIAGNNELRLITDVITENTIEVRPAFSVAPAADAFQLVRGDGSVSREIGIANKGGAAAIVGTVLTPPQSLPDGVFVNFRADGGVTPVCWDASGTTLIITILQ